MVDSDKRGEVITLKFLLTVKGAITLKPQVIFLITQKQHHWMTHQPKLGLVVPAIW